jgi:hypothetical protein
MLARIRLQASAAALGLACLAAACSSPSPAAPSLEDGGRLDSGWGEAGMPNDAGITDPAALQAPPQGNGVQMKIAPFAVPAGNEIQSCYFFKVSDLEQAAGFPANQPIEVHRVQVVQKAGSHHMNVFRVRTIVGLDPAMGTQTGMNGTGACFVSSNWADWPLLANTQQAGDQDWSYPDGVANELQPTEVLMLQTHYVNAATQTSPDSTGQVAINLWTLPADQVTAQIGTVFATDQNIRICQSNPNPTYEATYQFHSPVPVTIIGANGHFHSRGKQFDMYAWDGTSTTAPNVSARFYQSLAWDNPPMLHSPDLAVTVPAGGGVWYTCSYQWMQPPSSVGCAGLNAYDAMKHMTPVSQQDCCYTFGGVVDKNEHCNAFIYYYPKLTSSGDAGDGGNPIDAAGQ